MLGDGDCDLIDILDEMGIWCAVCRNEPGNSFVEAGRTGGSAQWKEAERGKVTRGCEG